MTNQSRRTLLQTAAVACVPTLSFAQNAKSANFVPQTTVTWSQLDLINGDTVKYAQLRGQVLVTYFWASWCPFCAEQSPEIDKLFNNFQSKGLYVQGHNYRFPSTWLDPRGKAELQKPPTVPLVMVYNKSGQLVQLEKGQMFAEDVQALSRWIKS
jgi:thiol-disulfide isomerase/thioredoxin